ncbi:MAG: hypothetical protein KAX49_00680 [Halanaerobiales bacterium]|nr:hypothetical protein [Halanaerobiales bacterium]
MNNLFCKELAKLFFIISGILILVLGFLSKVSLEVIGVRIFIGGGISTILGYLFGMVIDKENEKQLVNAEKEKYKWKMKERYETSKKKMEEQEQGEFVPMEVENLAKIVVDSLKD